MTEIKMLNMSRNGGVSEMVGYTDFLSMQEAAKYIHVSMSTMEKYSAKRMFPKHRPNKGKVFFRKSDLDLFMESCRLSSTMELTNDVNSCLQMLGAQKFNNPLKQAS